MAGINKTHITLAERMRLADELRSAMIKGDDGFWCWCDGRMTNAMFASLYNGRHGSKITENHVTGVRNALGRMQAPTPSKKKPEPGDGITLGMVWDHVGERVEKRLGEIEEQAIGKFREYEQKIAELGQSLQKSETDKGKLANRLAAAEVLLTALDGRVSAALRSAAPAVNLNPIYNRMEISEAAANQAKQDFSKLAREVKQVTALVREQQAEIDKLRLAGHFRPALSAVK